MKVIVYEIQYCTEERVFSFCVIEARNLIDAVMRFYTPTARLSCTIYQIREVEEKNLQ